MDYAEIQTIGESLGLVTDWSVFNGPDDEDYVTPDERVAYPEGIKLVYDCYGVGAFECVLPGPVTWLDLWRAADKLVRQSGDLHHIFIEAFVNEDDADPNTGLLTVSLETGS